MIFRILHILTIVAIPAVLLGSGPGKSFHVFKPDIPDTIRGIQIQFEVKQLKSYHEDNPVHIYCLCADIVNQNKRTERILVRYQCQGKQKSREIEIGANQQKIILVDKCLMTEENAAYMHEYFSLLGLDYKR
jgi:hypothetical protein